MFHSELTYQECHWFRKLLRLRHYLKVPFNFVWISFIEGNRVFSSYEIWKICVGLAHVQMNNVYPIESIPELMEAISAKQHGEKEYKSTIEEGF